MEPKSKQLTAKLIELRNAIKRKYKMFKEGAEESDILLEKQYKPIIQELRKKNNTDIMDVKQEIKEEQAEEPMDYELTDDDDEQFSPESISTPKAKDLSDLMSTPEQQASTTQFINTYFKNPITREYMDTYMRDTGGKRKRIDYVFGPRFMDGEKLMVGDKELDFDHEGNIKIGGVNYGATEGLYELLFKQLPDKNTYTEDDLNTYKSILFATNAHRDGYQPHGKVKSSRSLKYTRIIQKLFPTRGKGMTWKNTKSRDIIYWDDPNELVERLEHIAMSTETGNRVHANEIIGIVEELREAGFIKGSGNNRFKALLK